MVLKRYKVFRCRASISPPDRYTSTKQEGFHSLHSPSTALHGCFLALKQSRYLEISTQSSGTSSTAVLDLAVFLPHPVPSTNEIPKSADQCLLPELEHNSALPCAFLP